MTEASITYRKNALELNELLLRSVIKLFNAETGNLEELAAAVALWERSRAIFKPEDKVVLVDPPKLRGCGND